MLCENSDRFNEFIKDICNSVKNKLIILAGIYLSSWILSSTNKC